MPSPNHPHCYEITAFLSMHDNWRSTHNATWLKAAKGAYKLIVENFLNVDGTSALDEASREAGPNAPPSGTSEYRPRSYPLGPGARTGETCCSMFWIKFSQRFQLMAPSEERFAAEIEKTVYNAILRQLGRMENAPDSLSLSNKTYTGPAMRSFVNLQGSPEALRVPVATCCEGQGSRALGSLPEYVFTQNASAPGEGFWLNLFAPATLTVNATVVEGVAPNPPPVLPPAPPPPTPLPPTPPAPPLSWVQLAMDGYVPTSYAGSGVGYWPVKASDFADCKQECIASEHPNACMAITWCGSTAPSAPPPSPPPPPTKLQCNPGCRMEPTGTRYYFDGSFSKPRDLPVDACNAACINDPDCVQVTVGPGADRCVLYSAIFSTQVRASSSVQSFVKCVNSSARTAEFRGRSELLVGDGDHACAPHLSTRPEESSGCTLYRNVDLNVPALPAPNVSQWLLQGRTNPVEPNWIPSPPPAVRQESAARGTVTMSVVVNTSFPFGEDVSLTLGWADRQVHKVRLAVRLRIPSWLRSASVPVAVNGKPFSTGTPGSYLELERRTWRNGDVISFALPVSTNAVLLQYPKTAMSNIPGYEGQRYALKVGPLILPCVGPLDKHDAIVLPLDATAPVNSWLQQVAPLHFRVKGVAPHAATFKPSWHIAPEENFTTFPVFSKTDDPSTALQVPGIAGKPPEYSLLIPVECGYGFRDGKLCPGYPQFACPDACHNRTMTGRVNMLAEMMRGIAATANRHIPTTVIVSHPVEFNDTKLPPARLPKPMDDALQVLREQGVKVAHYIMTRLPPPLPCCTCCNSFKNITAMVDRALSAYPQDSIFYGPLRNGPFAKRSIC